MLNLIQTEFLKLRRKNLIWLMLSAALVMPFFATLYFRYLGKSNVLPMEFYRWSAFGYTLFIILPFVLGVFCTMLMYNEKQNDILKQLWIVPVDKIGYFFSKFFVIMMYSILFMLINAVASAWFSVLSGCVVFSWGSILRLFEKCLEIGLLTSFALIPVLSIATMAKGYILPICITLIYVFLGFILMGINEYLHPLTSASVIIMRNGDMPGVIFTQAINLSAAFLCICIWDITTVLLAVISLRKK